MQKYSHSGVIPIGGALLCLVGSALVTAITAVIYALIIRYIPFVYLNFLATLGFGFVMGVAVMIFAQLGKIRSKTFVHFAWLITLLFGMYVYWGASVWTRDGLQVGLSAFDPQVIWDFGERLFEKGTWGIFGNAAVTGWFLVAFWVAEVGVLGWTSYSTALSEVDQPFCETCNEWTEIEKGVALFQATGSEPEWDNLKLGDYSALNRIPLLTSSLSEYVRLDVAACPKCINSNFLIVQQVHSKVDSDGDESTTETRLLSNIILSGEQLAFVRELVDRAAEAAAEKEAAAEPGSPGEMRE